MKIRVAQVKVYPAKCKLADNHALLTDVLEEIAPHRPDVVVTPEGFLDGYVCTEKEVTRDLIGRYAIKPAANPYTGAVAQWAREHHCWVIFGCIRSDSGDNYNTALVYDRTGALAGHYDKVHCDRKYTPGESLKVFESDFGTFGVLICADRRWPETVRTLALKGARVIFNPTYGMSCDLNFAMMRTRAYESEVFIAFTHPRQSLITCPKKGRVAANNEDDSKRFTITDIDLAEADAVRNKDYPAHLRDRRGEIYEL